MGRMAQALGVFQRNADEKRELAEAQAKAEQEGAVEKRRALQR